MAIFDKVDKKKIHAVFLTTAGFKVDGNAFLVPGITLTDEMNGQHRRFISVADAKISFLLDSNKVPETREILLLNKDEILCTAIQATDVYLHDRKEVHAAFSTANNFHMEGNVLIPSEARLVDTLNVAEVKFAVMKNVEVTLITNIAGKQSLFQSEWVLVSKRGIVSVFPLETAG